MIIKTRRKPEEIKAVVFDMDGTLLGKGNVFTERTIAAVKTLRESGKVPVLATGRSYDSVAPYAHQLGIDTPVICFNGAAVFDPAEDKPLFAHTMNQQDAEICLEIGRKAKTHIHAFNSSGELMYERACEESAFYENHANVQGSVVDFDTLESLSFYKMMYVGDHDHLEELSREVLSRTSRDSLYAVFSLPFFFEMMSSKAGKVQALKEALSLYAITQEEVMVFGDGQNDLDMLTWAEVGVAMENGADAVKEAVSNRADPNTEEGVAKFLETFFAELF